MFAIFPMDLNFNEPAGGNGYPSLNSSILIVGAPEPKDGTVSHTGSFDCTPFSTLPDRIATIRHVRGFPLHHTVLDVVCGNRLVERWPCSSAYVHQSLLEVFRLHIVEKIWKRRVTCRRGHRNTTLPLANPDLRWRNPVGFMVGRRVLHLGPPSFDHQTMMRFVPVR